jgi:hypothetical protein
VVVAGGLVFNTRNLPPVYFQIRTTTSPAVSSTWNMRGEGSDNEVWSLPVCWGNRKWYATTKLSPVCAPIYLISFQKKGPTMSTRLVSPGRSRMRLWVSWWYAGQSWEQHAHVALFRRTGRVPPIMSCSTGLPTPDSIMCLP